MRNPALFPFWKPIRFTPGLSWAAGSLLGLAPWFLFPAAAIAQITQATITEILDGDAVFVEKVDTGGAGNATEVPATVNTLVEFQETVRTEDARAALTFDNGAAGRMGMNSQITVGQCLEVQQGILLVAGPANGCTATFAVGVQGTTYTIAIDDETKVQRIQVLDGIVVVQLTDESLPNAERIQQVRAGEELTLDPDGRIRERRSLTKTEVETLLRSELFNNFAGMLPEIENLELSLRNRYDGVTLPCLPGFQRCREPIRGLF